MKVTKNLTLSIILVDMNFKITLHVCKHPLAGELLDIKLVGVLAG